jgi:hypothetical protein
MFDSVMCFLKSTRPIIAVIRVNSTFELCYVDIAAQLTMYDICYLTKCRFARSKDTNLKTYARRQFCQTILHPANPLQKHWTDRPPSSHSRASHIFRNLPVKQRPCFNTTITQTSVFADGFANPCPGEYPSPPSRKSCTHHLPIVWSKNNNSCMIIKPERAYSRSPLPVALAKSAHERGLGQGQATTDHFDGESEGATSMNLERSQKFGNRCKKKMFDVHVHVHVQ